MMYSQAALLAAAFTPAALGKQLCDQYGFFSDQGHTYNNNMWGSNAGSGSQCLYIDSTSSSGVQWHATWDWSGSQDNVKSYPYSGISIPQKPLVSSVGSIPTSAEWSYSGNNIRADVAYDVFTASDPNHQTFSGDYEVMIWLGQYGGVQPIGPSSGTVNVGGYDWDLHIGMNGAMKVYSFVAPDGRRTSFKSDIKDFFNHVASNHGYPIDSQYLLTTQFGTEPFTGSGELTVSHWSASVN